MDGSPPDCPSMGFSRQEYWSGLPFPSPGDLPDPGIDVTGFCYIYLHWQAGSLPLAPPGKPISNYVRFQKSQNSKKTVKRSVAVRSFRRERERMNSETQGIFRAVKLFCMIP